MSKVNPKYKEVVERWQRQDDKRLNDDITWLLRNKEGRRILLWLNSLTGIYASVSSLEHLEYVIGRREVGLEILAKANLLAPEMVALATNERSTEIAERNEEIRLALEEDKTRGTNK